MPKMIAIRAYLNAKLLFQSERDGLHSAIEQQIEDRVQWLTRVFEASGQTLVLHTPENVQDQLQAWIWILRSLAKTSFTTSILNSSSYLVLHNDLKLNISSSY